MAFGLSYLLRMIVIYQRERLGDEDMKDKNWEQFQKTGSVSDYLIYRGISEENETAKKKAELGANENGNNHSTDGYGSVSITYR